MGKGQVAAGSIGALGISLDGTLMWFGNPIDPTVDAKENSGIIWNSGHVAWKSTYI
jgi:hypothetical protein